jgi:lipopolysaccharide transport system ATP-binding protein
MAVDVRALSQRVAAPGRAGAGPGPWALRQITLQVPAGQLVGLFGPTGSGKSTLLNCICGTLRPTEGEVVVRGRLIGLTELGDGLEPGQSGRDNVGRRAAGLGLAGAEVARVVDDVVELAELGGAMDRPVRTYSSGMLARLGLALASAVDPDVLVVDQVLGVADERFVRRILDRFSALRDRGCTVIVVPPRLSAPPRWDRELLLTAGRLTDGDPALGRSAHAVGRPVAGAEVR